MLRDLYVSEISDLFLIYLSLLFSFKQTANMYNEKKTSS